MVDVDQPADLLREPRSVMPSAAMPAYMITAWQSRRRFAMIKAREITLKGEHGNHRARRG